MGHEPLNLFCFTANWKPSIFVVALCLDQGPLGSHSGPEVRFWEVRRWTSSFRMIEGRVSNCAFPTDAQQ
jgi:hypothetical protein